MDRVFSEFSLVNWLNPLSCDSCMQKLLMKIPFLSSDLISYLKNLNSNGFIAVFILITSLLVGKKSISLALEYLQLGRIVSRSVILNERVRVSKEVEVPMALLTHYILIPQSLIDKITKDELAVIIYHEKEHLKWKDPLTRLLMEWIASLIWWVPTQFWINKIVLNQEIACDLSVIKKGYSLTFMAEALLKISKLTKGSPQQLACALLEKNHPTKVRLMTLLGLPVNTISFKSFLGVSAEVCVMLMCI